MVVSKLSVLLIMFILFVLNLMLWIKNVVVRFMVNVLFSLYSMIRSKISQVLLWLKKFCRGVIIVCFSVLGIGMVLVGFGVSNVVII